MNKFMRDKRLALLSLDKKHFLVERRIGGACRKGCKTGSQIGEIRTLRQHSSGAGQAAERIEIFTAQKLCHLSCSGAIFPTGELDNRDVVFEWQLPQVGSG